MIEVSLRNDVKREILGKLEDGFKDIEIPVYIRERDDEILSDILNLELINYGSGMDNVLIEMFFTPEAEDAVTTYFNTIVNINEEINPECVMDLSQGIAKLNYYIPFGAFGIDAEGNTLIYKLSTPISYESTKEQIGDIAELLCIQAIDLCERYVDILNQLSDGRIDAKEFAQILPQQ